MGLKINGHAFNGAVAALAAGSAAFATFAMPTDLFGRIVAASGLPAVLPAAQPPLGETARLAAVGAVAAAAFLFVWLLLRLFDRPAPKKQVVAQPRDDFMDEEWVAPRVRRADAHPDAPTRRPLLAGRELGEPAPPVEDAAPDSEDAPISVDVGPLPAFLGTADEAAQAPEAPAQEVAATEAAEPDVASESPPETAAAADAPGSEVGRPDTLQDNEVLELRVQDEHPSTAELLARLSLPTAKGQSLSSLLMRLDEGLARSEWPLPSPDGDEEEPSGDDRMRSVLDDLRKMAARRS